MQKDKSMHSTPPKKKKKKNHDIYDYLMRSLKNITTLEKSYAYHNVQFRGHKASHGE